MIRELDDVVLLCNLPQFCLKAGDIGTVVLVHGQGKGCEVEFTALNGESIAVTSMLAKQMQPGNVLHIPHARNIVAV